MTQTISSVRHLAQIQPVPRPAPADDYIDVGAHLATIWRGKIVVLAAALLALLLGVAYVRLVAKPVYRATAVVKLETQQENIVALDSLFTGMSGNASEVNTEVEVLRARTLMGQVVDALDLRADPEFNAALRQPGLPARLLAGIGSGPGPPPDDPAGVRDSVISALLARVSVRNVPQSLVFQITVESEAAQKAALVADTIAELYIADQLRMKARAMEEATGWLSQRVDELQRQLEAAEAARARFSASTSLVSAEALQQLERQIKDLRNLIVEADAAATEAAARVATLLAAPDRPARVSLAGDGELTRLLDRIDGSAAAARAFDARFEAVVQRAELAADRAMQQLEALKATEADLQRRVSAQADDLIRLQQLSREAEAIRLLYEHFLTRLNETDAQRGTQRPDSRILSHAVVPTAPAAPREFLVLAGAGVLGLLVGTVLVLWQEARSSGFRSARELEAATGLGVLGQVPLIPERGRRRTLRYLARNPASAAAEAVRNLRTSVLLTNVDDPPKVIVSTSAMPGEGKTTNSLALAQNLAGMGRRVLVLEGDIRRRTFSHYLDGLEPIGLVSVLSGTVTLREAVQAVPELGVDILLGEQSDTNAADLFSSDRFRTLTADLRERYDFIIIDTPPVLVVPDGRILAQVADAVLFTVRWDSTSRAQVEEAMRLFQMSQQRVTGFVLSQISPRGMRRYGYSSATGAYAAYGEPYAPT
ncbi:hypothetical protein OG2516_10851 [Oceanicola granulosus HTCC2516]|uniref:non-specific protein-tyrosine kinase n=1 Tax=Oceanicola granulosus (strain ATCC BAA-861 / DSM 15982 / KCTC 12143 / HTCC2516) TaxID=314256 RepID=Q2CK33_OCEGH|nr:polysaccharide biosynthesis tyrosine autokinase [Oceanicola granulosus]EAR52956.1 hypothetical protein OG2516_10851 [Oceanicola granulosus HTCC2516]